MSKTISDPRVQSGSNVEIILLYRSGQSERLAFDLVSDRQADYQAGFLGVSTPLAKAILGEKAGITVPYFTDELMAVEIVSIHDSKRKAKADTAAQRQATLKDAKDQIEFTNAVLFAASVDTKWGAYDADGLDYTGWKNGQSENSGPVDEER